MTVAMSEEESNFRRRIGSGPKPYAPDEVIDWSKCALAQRYPLGVYPGNGKANNSNKDLL